MSRKGVFLSLVAGMAAAGPAVAGVTGVDVILKEGAEISPGVTVTGLNSPFTSGTGKVGFVGQASDNSRFIWFDTGIVFNSNDALPDALTGGESTMGVSDAGGFIYSPSFNGADAVFRNDGVLIKDDDPAPGFPNQFVTFASRPTMLPDGTSHWVSGIGNAPGGSPVARTLYRAVGDTLTPVLSTGQVVDGFAISASGIGFDYQVSDNGNNLIMELTRSTGSTATDTGIYVNGSIVAQEGSPTGEGDNWAGWNGVSVNNSGNYIFAGDTNGTTTTDAFLAYNGVIGIREGDTIDGVTIANGASTRAQSINNLNQAAYIWGWGSGGTLQEHLFFSGDASDLSGTAVRLLSLGEMVDVNGDSIADAILSDFNASGIVGPGLDFAEDGFVYVEVDLTTLDGLETTEAIIRVQIPAPAGAAVFGLAGLAAMRRRR